MSNTGYPPPHLQSPQPRGTGSIGSEQRNIEFVTAQRDDNVFQDAVRHTSRVRHLKIILPIVGIVITLLLGGAYLFQQIFTPQIEIGNIAYKDGKLVMENPQLSGFDQKQRPYNLFAERAIQDAENPTRVQLLNINATLPVDGEGAANVIAGNAVYDAEAKTLKLVDKVKLETTSGIVVEFQEADVDIGNGWMRTASPFWAQSKEADVSADTLLVENSGGTMVFEGNVKMTLRPEELRQRQKRLAE